MDADTIARSLGLPRGSEFCVYVALGAFFFSALVFPFYIAWLKKKQIQQYIREEGPQSHAAKAKTPTMGGLCFILTSTIASAGGLYFWNLRTATVSGDNRYMMLACVVGIVGAFCGLIGLADDYAKVTSKTNAGLSAKFRLLTEFVLGGILGTCMYVFGWPGSHFAEAALLMPPGTMATVVVDVSYCFLLIPFLVAATTNALNLHDGMDGLAAGTSIQVFIVLALILLIDGAFPLAIVSASMVGALAAFLLYNKNPAQVFMGDTGSLFIGGLMAALVASGQLLFWFVPLAAIYVAETLSVIIQVVYFKLTKEYQPEQPMSKPELVWLKLTKRLPGEGKRMFRMAPLHHHYEAVGAEKGIKEWQVVACFWAAQLFICASVLFFRVYLVQQTVGTTQ